MLNLGVHPRTLLDSLKRRFHAAGGIIFENTAFKHADVHPVRTNTKWASSLGRERGGGGGNRKGLGRSVRRARMQTNTYRMSIRTHFEGKLKTLPTWK